MSEMFVYHFKPQGMAGELLIPLNELQLTHPSSYLEHVKKYKGREATLQRRIPILNCLWNDVLHISPINPQKVIDSWRESGLTKFSGFSGKIEVYRIPVLLLEGSDTVTYQSFNFEFGKSDPALEKYSLFDPNNFEEQIAVSPEQLEIWQQDAEVGRRLFWYSHTMHILTKQKVDTRLCELFSCE